MARSASKRKFVKPKKKVTKKKHTRSRSSAQLPNVSAPAKPPGSARGSFKAAASLIKLGAVMGRRASVDAIKAEPQEEEVSPRTALLAPPSEEEAAPAPKHHRRGLSWGGPKMADPIHLRLKSDALRHLVQHTVTSKGTIVHDEHESDDEDEVDELKVDVDTEAITLPLMPQSVGVKFKYFFRRLDTVFRSHKIPTSTVTQVEKDLKASSAALTEQDLLFAQARELLMADHRGKKIAASDAGLLLRAYGNIPFFRKMHSRRSDWGGGRNKSARVATEVKQERLVTLLQHLNYASFKQGEELFRKGEFADKVFIVLNGEVLISNVIPRLLTEKEKRREERQRLKAKKKEEKAKKKAEKEKRKEQEKKDKQAESVNLGAETSGEADPEEKLEGGDGSGIELQPVQQDSEEDAENKEEKKEEDDDDDDDHEFENIDATAELDGVPEEADEEICVLRAYDVAGEASVMESLPRHSTALCLQDTECLVIDKWTYHRFVRRVPDNVLQLVRNEYEKIRLPFAPPMTDVMDADEDDEKGVAEAIILVADYIESLKGTKKDRRKRKREIEKRRREREKKEEDRREEEKKEEKKEEEKKDDLLGRRRRGEREGQTSKTSTPVIPSPKMSLRDTEYLYAAAPDSADLDAVPSPVIEGGETGTIAETGASDALTLKWGANTADDGLSPGYEVPDADPDAAAAVAAVAEHAQEHHGEHPPSDDGDYTDEEARAMLQKLVDKIITSRVFKIRNHFKPWSFKYYRKCFYGAQLVQWLMHKGVVETPEEAVLVGRALRKLEFLDHVQYEMDFSNSRELFRFSIHDYDDKLDKIEELPEAPMSELLDRIVKYTRVTPEEGEELDARTILSSLVGRMRRSKQLNIGDKSYRLQNYRKSFWGTDMVSWLMKHDLAANVREAVVIGRAMQSHNVLDHINYEQRFKNRTILFRLTLDDDEERDQDDIDYEIVMQRVEYHLEHLDQYIKDADEKEKQEARNAKKKKKKKSKSRGRSKSKGGKKKKKKKKSKGKKKVKGKKKKGTTKKKKVKKKRASVESKEAAEALEEPEEAEEAEESPPLPPTEEEKEEKEPDQHEDGEAEAEAAAGDGDAEAEAEAEAAQAVEEDSESDDEYVTVEGGVDTRVYYMLKDMIRGMSNPKYGVPQQTHSKGLKQYDQCFEGSEAVKWIIETGAAQNEAEAVMVGRALQEQDLLDHVLYEEKFSNSSHLFRFSTEKYDDTAKQGTMLFKVLTNAVGFIHTRAMEVVVRHEAGEDEPDDPGVAGLEQQLEQWLELTEEIDVKDQSQQFQLLQQLTNYMISAEDGLEIEDRQKMARTYTSCFLGNDFVSWCLEKKIAKTRLGATALGKLMQRMGLLDHVTEDHAFKDMNLLYQFKVEDSDAEYLRIRSMNFMARRKYKKRAKVIKAQQAADQAYRRAPTTKKDAKLTQIRNVDHQFLSPVYIEPGMTVEDRLHKASLLVDDAINTRRARPHRTTKWFKRLDKFFNSSLFEVGMFIIVLLHMGLAWFEPPSIKDRGADKFQDRLPILTGVEVLFLTAYIIESAYDLIDLGWFWFRHAPMKIVRSTIILIMVSDLVMFSIFDGVSSDFPRFSRPIRPFLLLFRNRALRRLFFLAIRLMPRLFELIVMLLGLTIFYAVIGGNWFGDIRSETYNQAAFAAGSHPFESCEGSCEVENTLPGYVFDSFKGVYSNTLVTLFVVFTRSNMPYQAWPAYVAAHENQTYYFTFIVLTVFFLLNVLTAYVVQTYEFLNRAMLEADEMKERSALISAFQILDFHDCGVITYETFRLLIKARINYREYKIRALFTIMDKTGDGVIEEDEFLNLGDHLFVTITTEAGVTAKDVKKDKKQPQHQRGLSTMPAADASAMDMSGAVSDANMPSPSGVALDADGDVLQGNFTNMSTLPAAVEEEEESNISVRTGFRYVYKFVSSAAFKSFVTLVVVIDVVVLLLLANDRDNDSLSGIDSICLAVFFLEFLVHLLALDTDFITEHWVFLIITILHAVGVVRAQTDYLDGGWDGLILFRFLGLLKGTFAITSAMGAVTLFKYRAQKLTGFTAVVIRMVPVFVGMIFAMFTIVFYPFAIIGIEIFNGTEVQHGRDRCSDIGFINSVPAARFCDINAAMVSLFYVLSDSEFETMMYATIEETSTRSALYFVFFYFIGSIVLLNLMLAIFYDILTNESEVDITGMRLSDIVQTAEQEEKDQKSGFDAISVATGTSGGFLSPSDKGSSIGGSSGMRARQHGFHGDKMAKHIVVKQSAGLQQMQRRLRRKLVMDSHPDDW